MTQSHKQELESLHQFFQTAKFPPLPFELNKYIKVTNPVSFVNGALAEIEHFKGDDNVRDSLFKHLREMKAVCEKNILYI